MDALLDTVFMYSKTVVTFLLFRSAPLLLVPYIFFWIGECRPPLFSLRSLPSLSPAHPQGVSKAHSIDIRALLICQRRRNDPATRIHTPMIASPLHVQCSRWSLRRPWSRRRPKSCP
jgi:hypothetical protein